MKELRLQFISIDDWNRPVFKDDKEDTLEILKTYSNMVQAKKRFTISTRTKIYMNIYAISADALTVIL